MAVLDMLKRRNGFTDTDDAIADYVLANSDSVAEMSIAKLAHATHTSNAAVVRFCQKVGVDGYRTIRIELARELERARTNVMDVNPDQPFLENATTQDVMSAVANLSKQAIDETYSSASAEQIRKAARLIRTARHPVLYATGDARICTISFSNLLLKLGIICTLGDQYGDEFLVSNFMGPSDVAVFVTYSGSLINSLERRILSTLRQSNCKLIVITAEEAVRNRLPGTDCFILLPKSETRKGRIATYYSQACIRYVLNCIYGEIFSYNWQESKTRIDRYYSDDKYWTDEQP